MALLNYGTRAQLPGGIDQLLNSAKKPTYSNGIDVNTGDWAKIFFTEEGDIITHGRNYTHEFVGGVKGLVPDSSAVDSTSEGKRLHFLDNNGQWTQLEVGQLPMAKGIYDGQHASGANLLYSAKQVFDFFQAELSATDAMRFKGGVNPNNLTDFPKKGKCEIGDTYRVTEPGYYAGYELQTGDLLICIKESTETGKENVTADDVDGFTGELGKGEGEYWMVVESNINGTIAHYVNNVPFYVYTPNTDDHEDKMNETWMDIYAPVTGWNDSAGEVLISAGATKAPVWINVEDKDFINSTLKAQIGSKFEVSNEGDIKVTALNGSTVLLDYVPNLDADPDTYSHDWRINIKGKAAATKFGMTLDTGLQFFKPDGITTKNEYDGSEDLKLRLMPAQRADGMIGGVIVDYRTNLIPALNEIGPQFSNASTISVDDKGMIFLTYENICNALGFEPGDTTAVHNYSLIFADSSSDYDYKDVPASVENPFLNLTSINEDKTSQFVAGSIQFVGNDSIKVTSTKQQPDGTTDWNNIVGSLLTIDLQTATPDYLGGIKVFKNNVADLVSNPQITGDPLDTDNKYYGVELDKNGKAFVYVPWEDVSPSWHTFDVVGGGDDSQYVNVAGTSGKVVADEVSDIVKLIAGHGINLVADPDNDAITINSNVWEVVKPSKIGYAPAMVQTTNDINREHYVLSYIPGDDNPTWNRVPWEANKDTWRDIKVNGAAFLNNDGTKEGELFGRALNIQAPTQISATEKNKLQIVQTLDSGTREATIDFFSTWRQVYVNQTEISRDIHLGFSDSEDMVVLDTTMSDVDGDNVHYVGFELSWWNLNTSARELV